MATAEATTTVKDLPTHSTLGGPPPTSLSAPEIGEQWLASFSSALSKSDIPAILDHFQPDGYWRDMLALTWDFRTFKGPESIGQFLEDRLADSQLSALSLNPEQPPTLEKPWEDVTWLILPFVFQTRTGTGSGIARLVYSHSTASWRAYTLYTNLESLHGTTEQLGPNRNFKPNHGQWLSQLEEERAYAKEDPEVLIIGAGQSGLDVAVRLKVLGVKTLNVERNERVGDQWRGRYQALCLHDPVWYDHLPYLPFPPTWPVYTPAHKLADWLSNYAHTMELPIWLSSSIQSATYDSEKKEWDVVVLRGDGPGGKKEERRMREDFNGKIVHSTAHKTAADYIGKKVLIVGAATSAHDIAHDFANHGVEVTIFQRASTYIMTTAHGMPVVMRGLYWEGGPPTDHADRLSASLPNEVMRRVHRRYTREIAHQDRELLDGLDRRGFRRNEGVEGSGFLFLAYSRGGGYYLDVGASQLIIDGKIGLKNGCEIDRFTEGGVRFTDGEEVRADLVVFATGFGDIKESMSSIFPPQTVAKLKPVWGVDEEGEIRAAWGDSGQEGFWYMMGNLCLCRFHSKHIALQIKAMQMGVFGERYKRGKPS